jgi:hypothetical protein
VQPQHLLPPPPPPLNSLVSFNTSSRLIYYLPKPPWQKHEDDHYLDIQTDQCKESSCNCRGSRHYQRRHARTAEYRFITPWPATRVTIATEIDKRIRFDNPKVFLVIVQYERKLPHVTRHAHRVEFRRPKDPRPFRGELGRKRNEVRNHESG